MIYECLACGTRFTEMQQTRSEHRNGQCPSCGYKGIRPKVKSVSTFLTLVDALLEKELADLKAMREASRIRG